MISMTGFATQTVAIPVAGSPAPLSVTITLKTVNGRFFELLCKLPHACAALEPDIQRILRARLHRGTVNCSIYVHNPAVCVSELTPSWSVIESYKKTAHELKSGGMSGELTIGELLALPHVFDAPFQRMSPDAQRALLETFEAVVAQLMAHRDGEGAAMAADLELRLAEVERLVALVAVRTEQVLAERRVALTAQAKETAAQFAGVERDQIVAQLFVQLEKADVHEEIQRLKMHIKRFIEVMRDQSLEKGKRLDFVLQECFRETNTINAKCADAALSDYAISIKVELEKAREMVQNIV